MDMFETYGLVRARFSSLQPLVRVKQGWVRNFNKMESMKQQKIGIKLFGAQAIDITIGVGPEWTQV